MHKFRIIILFISVFLILAGCKNGKLPGADARKVPYSAKERVKRNLEAGKGFRLDNAFKKSAGGDFEFASSNELWRASLDIIDFMPLLSVDYGGGIIITDWYGEENEKDSIKISIQFLSNEIRSDALKIKVFKKNCTSLTDWKIFVSKSSINEELRVAILKKAALYKNTDTEKNKKEYPIYESSSR